MDGEGLGGITPLRLSFLKQSLTPALDGSPYDDKMTVSGTNIWPSCGNIYSIPKINKNEYRGKERFKT